MMYHLSMAKAEAMTKASLDIDRVYADWTAFTIGCSQGYFRLKSTAPVAIARRGFISWLKIVIPTRETFLVAI